MIPAEHAPRGHVAPATRLILGPGQHSLDLCTLLGDDVPQTCVASVTLNGRAYRFRVWFSGGSAVSGKMAAGGERSRLLAKAAGPVNDTLVVTKNNYQAARRAITSYNVNVGTITLTRIIEAPVLSGPSSSTGSFALQWTYGGWTGLGSTSDRFELEESTTSPTSGFSVIFNTTPGQHPASYTFVVTRTAGTYYYRVRAYNISSWTPYSNVITVQVTQQQRAVLRVVNNTHYAMIDIRLNNTQQVGQGQGIPAGGYADFEFTSAGTVSYVLGIGLWDGSYRNVWFTLTGQTSVTMGQTTTLTYNNPTIGQLLTAFRAQRTWSGDYWVNLTMYVASFVFTQSGGWTFYDNGVQRGTGTVTLVSWPDYASIVQFKICPTCDVINLAYPFASFMYRNGPSSWPTIEYVAQ